MPAALEPSTASAPAVIAAHTFDKPTASMVSGLSAKTLDRLPAEQVGRFKVGRRVLFLRSKLLEFLESLANQK